MGALEIQFATDSDFDQIYEFLDENFHDHAEPIQRAHKDKDVRMHPHKEFIKSCIESGTTLVGFIDNVLVGVLIAAKIHNREHERNAEAAKTSDTQKSTDVLQFLSYIDEKANYCNRLQIPEALHMHIVSVHKDYQGRGIARKLFEFCIENGRQLKFRAVTVDCTNSYTAKIAAKLNFTLISIVTYDEYNGHIGKNLFSAIAPHTEIKSYALMLE